MTIAIASCRAATLPLPLTAPFATSKRTAYEARNVLFRIDASDGSFGIGAAVPVEYVTGESVESVHADLSVAAAHLAGIAVDRLYPMLDIAGSVLPDRPAARAAVEMAIFDLWARRRNLPLWHFFGGSHESLVSDLTIPIVSAGEAASKARDAVASGFAHLKIKVGDPGGIDADLRRIEAVAIAAPQAILRIDANQAFSASSALQFIRDALRLCPRIELIEQPTPASDTDALCEVRCALGGSVRLFADESVQSISSAAALIRSGAVDGINIKIMKSGVYGAWRIAGMCAASGIALMMGCMLESRLPLSASVALAAGCGWFDRLDLDSHHLVAPSLLTEGGFRDDGPVLAPEQFKPGWGVALSESVWNNSHIPGV